MISVFSPTIRAISELLRLSDRGIKALALILGFLVISSANLAAQAPSRDRARNLLATQPLWFEAAPDRGAMVSHFARRGFEVSAGGSVRIVAPVAGHASEVVLTMQGADTTVPVWGDQRLPGESNYLMGQDRSKWRHQVPHYAQAKLNGIYPGIDLTFYGKGGSLEYDYAVAPESDPGAIRLLTSGQTRLDTKTGDLLVTQTGSKEELLRLHKPVAYQVRQDGSHAPVAASYVKNDDASVGFTLGRYDHTRPLILDPVITYSSYFGGSGFDEINDIKTDAAGDIYLLVETNSTDLPATKQIAGACVSGCGPSNPSTATGALYNKDIYVAKLDSTGKTLLFSTYIGGSADEVAGSFALGSDGTIYIAGETTSTDFPLVHQYSSLTATDAYGTEIYSSTLTKLSADGSTILYSSLLGGGLVQKGGGCCSTGQNSAQPGSVAVGANGIAYLIGYAATTSEGYSFGTFRDQKGGTYTVGDGSYLARFDTTKSGADSLLFAIPYGLPGTQKGLTFTAMALDSKGNVWVTGVPNSYNTISPTPDALQPVCDAGNTCQNIFLQEMDPTGAVLYATYFGGTQNSNGGPGIEQPYNIFLDASDNIYIAGATESVDFPLKNAAYPTFVEGNGFLTKFAAGAKSVLYSTYEKTQLPLVAAASSGIATLAGIATTGFPVVNGTANNVGNGTDAYYEVFDTTKAGAASLLIASYLGAPGGNTLSYAMTIDAQGDLLFGGYTRSTGLPLVNPYQSACSAGCSDVDGFVTRVQISSAISSGSVSLVPATQSFPKTAVEATSATMTSTLTNTTSSAFLFTPSFTDSTDFKETDTCNGMVAAGADCTFSFTFSPQSPTPLTSTFTLTGTATPNTTLTVALSGTGTGAAAFTITPSAYTFGSVAGGSTPQTETLVLKNTGNVADNAVTFSLAESDQGPQTPSFAYTDNCTSLAVDATCNLVVTFIPHAGVAATGTLTVNGDPGVAPVVATITGTGTEPAGATLSTTSYSFGSIATGTTTPATTFTLANTGGTSLTVSSLTIGGSGAAAFAILPGSSTCGTAFAANSSCTFSVTFAPASAASYAATVNLVDQAGTQTLALTGTGTASSPTVTPVALDFGSVTYGAISPVKTFTITNPNAAAVTLVTGSGTAATRGFGLTYICNSIPANGSCTDQVEFFPDRLGAFSGSLLLTFSDGSTATVALTGVGVQQPASAFTPASVAFASIGAGETTASTTLTLTNPGPLQVTLTTLVSTGPFPTVGGTCTVGQVLVSGASCTVFVAFSPTAPGTYTGNVVANFKDGSTLALPSMATAVFNGTAVVPVPITVSPTALDFGSVTYGTISPVKTFTITNPNAAAVTLVTGSGTAATRGFGLTYICNSIPANGSCTDQVEFFPDRLGAFSGSLLLTFSDGSTATIALTGTAIAAPDFTLTAPMNAAIEVLPGSTGTLLLQVGSAVATNPYTSPITFSASNLPVGALAFFTPATVTPGAAGASTTMTIAVLSTAQNQPPATLFPQNHQTAFGISAAALLAGLFGLRRKRPARLLLLLLCTLGLTGAMLGCGSGKPFPATPSNVVVTATSGSISHTISVTLTIE